MFNLIFLFERSINEIIEIKMHFKNIKNSVSLIELFKNVTIVPNKINNRVLMKMYDNLNFILETL